MIHVVFKCLAVVCYSRVGAGGMGPNLLKETLPFTG